MDRQKMFDRAWHYYVTEGHPPSTEKSPDSRKDEKPTCVYFDKKTRNRCAIGIQLTPEQARRMPRGGIYTLLQDDGPYGYIDPLALRGEELRRILGVDGESDMRFLTRLQEAHDQAAVPVHGEGDYFLEWFAESMRAIASHWKLTVPGEAAPEAEAEEEAVLCAQ